VPPRTDLFSLVVLLILDDVARSTALKAKVNGEKRAPYNLELKQVGRVCDMSSWKSRFNNATSLNASRIDMTAAQKMCLSRSVNGSLRMYHKRLAQAHHKSLP
jgi:hypothetical protein